MTFFKLIFLAAVLFFVFYVRVAHAFSEVPNHVLGYSLHKGGQKCSKPRNCQLKWEVLGFRDIVINEIMADPSPPNKLPDAEFIELLNTSDNVIDLTGWTISDPRSTTVLPAIDIKPGQLITLCKNGQQDLFAEFGTATGLTGWPTLNNSEDELILKTAAGATIDVVRYTKDWYKDHNKSEGGWSLEQVNPFDPCAGGENWKASEDPRGGSPGLQNSVFEIIPDITGPEIGNVLVKNPNHVMVWFNEKIHTKTIRAGNVDISPANEIDSLDYEGPFTNNITIRFKNALSPNTLYTVEINNVTDCSGNLIHKTKNSFQFALAVAADPMNLVINEVLFNPRSGGKDFVEIYNASQNYINLKAWRISNSQSTAENPKIAFIDRDVVLRPAQYLVITENISILKADYPFGMKERFNEVKEMPVLADDYGNVTLQDSLGRVIDTFDYEESYHLGLIKDLNGVSLERISPADPTNSRDNWHSAASAVGYATPGYENSQKLLVTPVSDQIFVDPKIFAPNNDGVKDFASINYQFDKSGYLISIFIYDMRGRRIREIVNNSLAGVQGFYQWNGTNDSNKLVHPGYYIVLLDVLDPDGRSFQVKKTVVVAPGFE